MAQFIPAADRWLMANTPIPPDQRAALTGILPDLLQSLPPEKPSVIAISGAPGTGKSTLAGACLAALAEYEIHGIIMSLDDYYLPAGERQALAQTEHPLFLSRGVPGTHDLEMLTRQLSALLKPGHEPVRMPRFDKSVDDRRDSVNVVRSGDIPDYIFLEGWIVGVPPQHSSQLTIPVNDLESRQDRDGAWRRRVNGYLHDYHQALDPLIDERWYLQAPNWESVVEWRLLQEQCGYKPAMNRNQVRKFLQHFQRLYRHMQESFETWADTVIRLDANHMCKLEICKPGVSG